MPCYSFLVSFAQRLTLVGLRGLQFSGWSVFLKGEWNTATFVTNYLPMMLFPVMYLGKRLWSGVTFVRPEDMDFKTGLAEALEAS